MARAARAKKPSRTAASTAAARRPSRRTAGRRRTPATPEPKSDELERVRNLISLDATRLVARLDRRADEMIALFSRHRDREPLLAPLDSWIASASFSHLALLAPSQQAAVAFFLDELAALRWYVRYTDDMPSAAQQKLRSHRRSLGAAYERLVAAIGPALEAPPPDTAEQ